MDWGCGLSHDVQAHAEIYDVAAQQTSGSRLQMYVSGYCKLPP
jgi:hypothetical protein